MKYKISNAYLDVNGEPIPVGVILGKENKPRDVTATECITMSEYKKGIKEFRYGGKQYVGDMMYHIVGTFIDFKAKEHVDQKWIDELKNMGYDTTKLINA